MEPFWYLVIATLLALAAIGSISLYVAKKLDHRLDHKTRKPPKNKKQP
jgi:hypothetical protein